MTLVTILALAAPFPLIAFFLAGRFAVLSRRTAGAEQAVYRVGAASLAFAGLTLIALLIGGAF